MIKDTIIINESIYKFKETFDVNLTLSYENDNWSNWEIVREFISNALDSVSMDISKVSIESLGNNINIHDLGLGYPIVYAKRIGASSKKDNPESIGMFGEGSKMAILTCIRNDINIIMASQNWLIVPKSVESDGQSVLFYDIYEADTFIQGSLVSVEATEPICSIIDNVADYFLLYSNQDSYYGDHTNGIYSKINDIAKLYNKGVYIKDLTGLYSYAISFEKLNRDRNLISDDDVFYQIRDLWENVSDVNLIANLINISTHPYEIKKSYIEFKGSLYSNHYDKWREAFLLLYGNRACISTNDIASREATCLGFTPVYNIDYNIGKILKMAGIKNDIDCIDENYEFDFVEFISKRERHLLNEIKKHAAIAGIEDIPDTIKIFTEYAGHANVSGAYNANNQQIYLKQELFNTGVTSVLKTFLHELTHHLTKADDLDRAFADQLCSMLASTIVNYSNEIGFEYLLKITAKGIELPEELQLSARDLSASIIIIGDELIIKVGAYIIKTKLREELLKPKIFTRKLSIVFGAFVISLPEEILENLINKSEHCRAYIKSNN
jgi:hypothetical protein